MKWIPGAPRRLKPLLWYLIVCLHLYLFYSLASWKSPETNSHQNRGQTTAAVIEPLQQDDVSVNISTESITESPSLILDEIDRTELRFPIDPLIISSTDGARCTDKTGRQTDKGHHQRNFTVSPSSAPLSSEAFRWQPIATGRNDSLLVSAFYDPRSNPASVRILGLSTGGKAAREFCQLWFNDDQAPEYVAARFQYIIADNSRRYAASFHICYIRHDKIPYAVSLVTDQCVSSPSNLLRVQFNQMPSQPPERDFTVCVTPLNNKYDNYQQLVEMIEVNRMFGAQKFVFYNYSTGTDILPYLRRYEEEGIVEVVPWRLPVNADLWPDDPRVVPEVHYFGQVAALNDCLYRNMLVSRFVVFTDLDEIIVPRGRHTTWAEVLDAATRRMLGNPPFNQTQAFPGAYVIQNTFFRSDWGDDSRANEDQLARDLKLRTLLKTKREAIIYRWYSRSKLIVWTKAVFTVGIHSVSGFVDDGKVVAVKVAADDALLHHYRLNMWPDDPKNPPQPTQDRHMHSFYDEITNRTLDRHNRVRQ